MARHKGIFSTIEIAGFYKLKENEDVRHMKFEEHDVPR